MSKVIILLAEGFEELEAVAIIDVLRRAGIEIVSAGRIKEAMLVRDVCD